MIPVANHFKDTKKQKDSLTLTVFQDYSVWKKFNFVKDCIGVQTKKLLYNTFFNLKVLVFLSFHFCGS